MELEVENLIDDVALGRRPFKKVLFRFAHGKYGWDTRSGLRVRWASIGRRKRAGRADRRALRALQESPLRKRDRGVLRDHDVIENTNVHQSKGLLERAR